MPLTLQIIYIHTHTHKLCGQNTKFLNIKTGDIYKVTRALRG